MTKKKICPIHGENCPGDDGGFLIDGNHPDDMYGVGLFFDLDKLKKIDIPKQDYVWDKHSLDEPEKD